MPEGRGIEGGGEEGREEEDLASSLSERDVCVYVCVSMRAARVSG